MQLIDILHAVWIKAVHPRGPCTGTKMHLLEKKKHTQPHFFIRLKRPCSATMTERKMLGSVSVAVERVLEQFQPSQHR